MSISRERKACVVSELTRDVDDASAFVQQEGSEAMAEVVWARMCQVSRLRVTISE